VDPKFVLNVVPEKTSVSAGNRTASSHICTDLPPLDSINNNVDLYSGCSRFQSKLDYHLYRLFCMVFLGLPGIVPPDRP
jgi:hypothetical protein